MEHFGEHLFVESKVELADKLEYAEDRLGADISIGDTEGLHLPDLTLTPFKPNFARSVAKVKVAGEIAGDLYVIVFRQGDSTGDFSAEYPEGSLLLPETGSFGNIDEVYPRSISGTYPRPKPQLAEICIPLCNAMVWEDERVNYYGGTELRILGLGDSGDTTQIKVIDSSRTTHARSSVQSSSKQPSFLTLGTDNFGRRVGDPHAVFNPSNNIQIAGFLAVDSPKWFDLLASFDPVNPYVG